MMPLPEQANAGTAPVTCVFVTVNEMGWHLSCGRTASHHRGPLAFCATHAPRGSRRIVPLTIPQRLGAGIRYVTSLLTLAAMVFALTAFTLGAWYAVETDSARALVGMLERLLRSGSAASP